MDISRITKVILKNCKKLESDPFNRKNGIFNKKSQVSIFYGIRFSQPKYHIPRLKIVTGSYETKHLLVLYKGNAFFIMSQGSLNPKNRFLGQKVCPVARWHTHTETHTGWLLRAPFQGFRSFSINLLSRIGPTSTTTSCSGQILPQKTRGIQYQGPYFLHNDQNVCFSYYSYCFGWKNPYYVICHGYINNHRPPYKSTEKFGVLKWNLPISIIIIGNK